MVPTPRLLIWTALVGLPFTLLASVLPEGQGVVLLVLAGSIGAVVGDALLSLKRLAGIGVRLPEVVRLQKDRPGEIEVEILNDVGRSLPLRFGLDLREEIGSAEESLVVRLPAGVPVSRVRWQCRPMRRGQFNIAQCFLETPSWLGFWNVRAARPAHSELRIYPNLIDERRNVAALFLARGHAGIRVQRQSGQGRDFEKLREYVPGDSYDEIHWRASAKRGHPVTKIFQVERTQEVYVVIDASRLTAREMPGRDAVHATVLERFMTSGLILALAAQQQGDLYGLVTFSDRVERFVRARTGKAHYDACRDALYTLEPRRVTPNYEELAAFIRARLRKRALLVVLTALDDPVLAESFVKSIDLVSRQHLVLVNMLRPPGAAPLFSGDRPGSVDAIYEKIGGHLQWHELCELEKVLQRRGVTLRQLTQERMTLDLVSQYLNVKARQLL